LNLAANIVRDFAAGQRSNLAHSNEEIHSREPQERDGGPTNDVLGVVDGMGSARERPD